MSAHPVRLVVGALAAALLTTTYALPNANAQTAQAPAATSAIESDGAVNVPGFRLPPSVYLSPEARAALPRTPTDPEAQMGQMLAAGTIGPARARIGQLMAPQINRFTARYPVTMEDATIAGVPAVRVRPATRMPSANARKVLLNLPGGGFVMGAAHGTGMLESIPVAALTNVEVISITYRQAPEHRYPAATDDVVAVYRELLRTHRPQDIIVFGCSAGGLLTAETMARLQREHLPLPAAIGIFCASADARFEGDSHYYARPFQALTSPEIPRTYFGGVDRSDPMASPVLSPDLLRHFPPTLLITSTRAMDLSSAVNTHRELVKAGVEADLHVWDGLGHAFFYNIDLPESREAYDVMATFFSRHLGLRQPRGDQQ